MARLTLRELARLHRAGGKIAMLTVNVRTIGIGAGLHCSVKVLVLHDMFGVSGYEPRFARNFMAGASGVAAAIRNYVAAVKDGSFPGPKHCY